MSDLLILSTDSGVILSNKAGTDSLFVPSSGQAIASSLMPDSVRPTAWYFNKTSLTGKQVDLYTSSLVPSRSISGIVNIRSVQADPMTGNVYLLQPYLSPQSPPYPSESLLPKVVKSNQSTLTQSEVVLKLKNDVEQLFFAMDMKVDKSRRRIWFADTGNNRVLEVNIDTMKLVAIYDDPALLSPTTIAIDQLTGNAFVRTYDRADSAEVIYRLGNSRVISTYDVTANLAWTINGSVDWLNPNVESIIRRNLAIPFPHSGSMTFDHMRGNLWWLSSPDLSMLYLLNVNTMIGASLNLVSHISHQSTIDVDLVSGDVFVSGWTSSLTGKVVRVDRTCFYPPRTVYVNSSKITQVMVLQGNEELLPAVWNGVSVGASGAPAESGSSQSGTSSSSESSLSSSSSFGDVKSYLITLPEPAYDSVFSKGTDTFTPWVDTYLWAYDESGLSELKVGVVPGMPNESFFVPASATTLPRFSWSAIPYGRVSVFVFVTPDGRAFRAEYDSVAHTIKAVGTSTEPAGNEVAGLSVTPDSGNAYVSGSGLIAKMQIDTPVEQQESSASSVAEEGMPYQRSDRTNINDLSVQWHESSGIVWCTSKSRGTLVKIPDFLDVTGSMIEYGGFDAPFKAIWSEQHSAMVVFGERMSYTFDPISNNLTTQYGFVGSHVVDADISPIGDVIFAANSDTGAGNPVRIVSKNFYTMKLDLALEGVKPSKVAFVSEGTAVLAAETIGGGSTIFYLVDVGAGTATPQTGSVLGTVAALFYDRATSGVFAVMSDGRVLIIGASTESGLSVGQSVLMAKGNLIRTVETAYKQTKIRVYVGSAPGLNDMWDSGEVETAKTSVLYGGGDNLIGGQKYWVYVSLCHEILGWSPPQVKEFIAPRA